MQPALVAILLAVLAAATVVFAVTGILHRRRVGILSRVANRCGLRFSSDDPFDVPRSYADFVPVACGHSARARNVTYGRWHGLPIRSFDFRYEAGHGTQRLTRNFVVVVVQLEHAVPPVLMWNTLDAMCPPLEAVRCVDKISVWMCRGDEAMVRNLAQVLAPLERQAVCLQTRADQVMLWMPSGRIGRLHAPAMECAEAAARMLTAPPETQDDVKWNGKGKSPPDLTAYA